MTTRVAVCLAVVVWIAAARVMYYAIWQRPWRRPTHVKVKR